MWVPHFFNWQFLISLQSTVYSTIHVPNIFNNCTIIMSAFSGVASLFVADYGRDLEKDVISETSGHFKRLLVSMLTVSIIHSITFPIV